MKIKSIKEKYVENLLEEGEGSVIKVQIEGGLEPMAGFLVMDSRDLPSVHVSHETQTYPWPFPDDSITLFMAGNVIQHISRENNGFIKFMDECWRCLKSGGQLMISAPFAGSTGFWSDPKNVNGIVPQVFFNFDPEHISGMYQRHKPKPWEIKNMFWQTDGLIEVLLAKRAEHEKRP